MIIAFIKFYKSVTPDVRSASFVFSRLHLLFFIPSCDRTLLSSIRRALNPELGRHPRAILLVCVYIYVVCSKETQICVFLPIYPPFHVSRTRYTYLSSCYFVVTSQCAANEACFGTDPRYLYPCIASPRSWQREMLLRGFAKSRAHRPTISAMSYEPNISEPRNEVYGFAH